MALLSASADNSDNIDFGSPAAFDDLTTMTVILKVRVDTLTAGEQLMAKRANAGATDDGWQVRISGGSGAMQFRQDGTTQANYISDTDMLVASTWRWVAVSHDPGGTALARVKMYAGNSLGALAETASYPTTVDVVTPTSDAAFSLRIANHDGLTESPSAAFEYAVLYNTVVSLANIQAAVDSIEDTGTNSYTTGRIGEWQLGWSGGTAATDVSGGGNNGTVTGMPNTAGELPYAVGGGSLLGGLIYSGLVRF